MWTLDKRMARFRESYTDGLDFELCSDADLADVAPTIYAQAAHGMPGAMSRDDFVWQQYLGMTGLSHEKPSKARPAVLARSGGEPVGYARYTVKESSEQRVDTSVLTVHDLCAVTPRASAAMWQFLTGIDLVAKIEAGDRPVHEPLPWLLHDRRAARQSERADFQWVAVLDAVAALSGRTYDVPGRSVLSVVGQGTFQIESDGTSSDVTPTTKAPDVTLPPHALGSTYLGQMSLTQLFTGGLVEEHTRGGVAALDALLHHAPTAAIGHTWF